MHAHCWNLLERLIIQGQAEKHLDKLVEALRLSFRKQIIDPPWLLDQDEIRMRVGYDLPRFNLKPGDEIAYNPEIAYEVVDDETRYLHRDPVRITEVDCLLKKALLSLSEKKRKKKSRGDTIMTTKHPFAALGLALKLQYLVLDHLDCHDVAMLHAAFAAPLECAVSDSYWIKRAPQKAVYEIQDFINDEKKNRVDWEYLCLEAEQIVQTSEQLKNRQRNLHVIKEANYIFFMK